MKLAIRPIALLSLLAFTVLPLQAAPAAFDLSKLPLPPGAKKIFLDAHSAIYSVGLSVAETREACEKLLLAQGWQPYGFAGQTRYYKRGTTRLLATVQTEEGQAARTMISYLSEAMSADLPLPPDAEEVQYNDSAKRLGFLVALTTEGVADFYRKALAPGGWTTTMEKPDKTDFKYVINFRNARKELIHIEMTPTDGKQRTDVTYSTAEEVAAEQAHATAQIAMLREKNAKEAAAPKPKVTLTLPADTTSKALTKKDLRLNLTAGKAKSAMLAMRKELLAAGWKETSASLESAGGMMSFSQGERMLTINYMDPGFMPADVTVIPSGVEIELAGGK